MLAGLERIDQVRSLRPLRSQVVNELLHEREIGKTASSRHVVELESTWEELKGWGEASG